MEGVSFLSIEVSKQSRNGHLVGMLYRGLEEKLVKVLSSSSELTSKRNLRGKHNRNTDSTFLNPVTADQWEEGRGHWIFQKLGFEGPADLGWRWSCI